MDQALAATQTFPIDRPNKQVGSGIVSHSAYRRPHSHPQRSADVKPCFDLSTAVGLEVVEPMPEFADQTVLVYTQIEMLADQNRVPMGFMNRTNWIPQAEPLIYLSREQWDEHQLMPSVRITKIGLIL